MSSAKNAFLRCANPKRLQALADSLTTAIYCSRQKWSPHSLPSSLRKNDDKSAVSTDCSFSQVEYCDNLIFFRRTTVDEFAERLLDMNRTIRPPKKITMIFGRKVTKNTKANCKP